MDKEQEKRWLDLTDEMLKRLNSQRQTHEFLEFKIKDLQKKIEENYEQYGKNLATKNRIKEVLGSGANIKDVFDLLDEIE
jgi:hypothetical protein